MWWAFLLVSVLAGLYPWPRAAGAGAVVVIALWLLAEGLGHA